MAVLPWWKPKLPSARMTSRRSGAAGMAASLGHGRPESRKGREAAVAGTKNEHLDPAIRSVLRSAHQEPTTRLEGAVHDALVEQAQRGDAEAFDTLARLVGDRCLAIAVRILRDVDLAE